MQFMHDIFTRVKNILIEKMTREDFHSSVFPALFTIYLIITDHLHFVENKSGSWNKMCSSSCVDILNEI